MVTASRRRPHTGPRGVPRPYPPSATQQRALQGDKTLGEGGRKRENPGNSTGKNTGHARPRHSLTEPRAAPAAASRARPHWGGAAHARSGQSRPAEADPFMAAPERRPAGSAPAVYTRLYL